MPQPSRPVTENQKAEAVRAVVEAKRSFRTVAREHGVSHVQVRRWVLAWRIAHPEPVAPNPAKTSPTGIVARLESIRGQALALRAELDALVSMLR